MFATSGIGYDKKLRGVNRILMASGVNLIHRHDSAESVSYIRKGYLKAGAVTLGPQHDPGLASTGGGQGACLGCVGSPCAPRGPGIGVETTHSQSTVSAYCRPGP